MHTRNQNTDAERLTLILGGTGKTGRRVAERLFDRNVPVRIGSRSGERPFDWEKTETWDAVLQNVTSVYVAFYPDLAVPGAPAVIRAFTDLAVRRGVERLVLLSGRGEETAQDCERIVQDSGIAWTIVRASWFSQNFSEGFLREMVLGGQVALPAGTVQEPFVDAEDIADVAVAALTEEGHAGQLYEVTGPRLLTFGEAVAEIAEATGRPVEYTRMSHEAFASALAEQAVPEDVVWLMRYLFTTVLDGRNAVLTDGVQRALGRPPRDFSAYVREAAARGEWQEEGIHIGG